MYLLIPASLQYLTDIMLFTSHYVSINSAIALRMSFAGKSFTSHYVSINSEYIITHIIMFGYLHPTMYLLILKMDILRSCRYPYLHPTMYLLIHA